MSKIKQLIDIDNNQYDLYIATPDLMVDSEQPSETDWAIVDLIKSIETLEKDIPYDKLDDIKKALNRLNRLEYLIKHPF